MEKYADECLRRAIMLMIDSYKEERIKDEEVALDFFSDLFRILLKRFV